MAPHSDRRHLGVLMLGEMGPVVLPGVTSLQARLRVIDADRPASRAETRGTFVLGDIRPTPVISWGDRWEYRDDGDPPSGWRRTTGGWPEGPAELGYGDGDEATVLSGGEPTVYFRRAFTLDGPPTDHTLQARFDDAIGARARSPDMATGLQRRRERCTPHGPRAMARHGAVERDHLGVSAAESVAAAANVTMGMTEAPLLIRPYIVQMTLSELFCLMTTGLATIAGTVMVLYAAILGEAKRVHQRRRRRRPRAGSAGARPSPARCRTPRSWLGRGTPAAGSTRRRPP